MTRQPAGAQMLLLLNIGRLKRVYGLDIEFLLLQGGKLETDTRPTHPPPSAPIRRRSATSSVICTASGIRP